MSDTLGDVGGTGTGTELVVLESQQHAAAAAAEETKLGDLEGGGEAARGDAARARAPVKVRRGREGGGSWFGGCPRLLSQPPPPP